MNKALAFGLGAALAAALLGNPASAQKAKDTLRMSAIDTYAVLSPYDLPLDEASPIYNQIYTSVITMNENTGKWVGLLASDWRHIDPLTIEFDLRNDITLHSGKKFNADDFIAPINYTIDPKTKIRSKNRYTWIKSTEKLGPYKVRLHLTQPFALDLLAIAYRFFVEDSEVLGKLEKPEDYGRVSAASAGSFKLVSMDRNKGAVVERFEGLAPHLKEYLRAPIKRIEIVQVHDMQTQVAQLLTGGLDLLRNVPEDTAKEIAKNPNVVITPMKSSQYTYLMMDAIARSGRKELTDLRVRQAMEMAIDRQQIAKEIVPGGAVAEVMDAMCFSFTTACKYSTKPYPYDPAGAKKLLAEAGYPNGFEMTLYVHEPVKDIAVAVAGYLQKVGIKMSVSPQTINNYVQLREEGKLTAFVGSRPTGNFPEGFDVLDSFFSGSRDYWNDPVIQDAMKKGYQEPDNEKRGEIFKAAFDRNNTQAYVFALSSMPWVFAHSKDVRVEYNPLKANSVEISDIFWK